jgi:hypothetical protein
VQPLLAGAPARGQAEGVLWLGPNAAGSGWFVDATPGKGPELGDPSNQGRVSPLASLEPEIGRPLGRGQEEGVMPGTLTAGPRRTARPAPTADLVGPGVDSTNFESDNKSA